MATWGPGGAGLSGTWGRGCSCLPRATLQQTGAASETQSEAGVAGLETQASQSSSLAEAKQQPGSSGHRASTPSLGPEAV